MRARADPGADVHVARHQDHAGRQVARRSGRSPAARRGRPPPRSRASAAACRGTRTARPRSSRGRGPGSRAGPPSSPSRSRPSRRPSGSATRTSPRSSIADGFLDRVGVEPIRLRRTTRSIRSRQVGPRPRSLPPHPRTPSRASAARSHSSIVGTIAIRTYPSPSGPKNEPGATTTSAPVEQSSDHVERRRSRRGPPPTGRTSPRSPRPGSPCDANRSRNSSRFAAVARARLLDVRLVAPRRDRRALDELLRRHARPTGGAPSAPRSAPGRRRRTPSGTPSSTSAC